VIQPWRGALCNERTCDLRNPRSASKSLLCRPPRLKFRSADSGIDTRDERNFDQASIPISNSDFTSSVHPSPDAILQDSVPSSAFSPMNAAISMPLRWTCWLVIRQSFYNPLSVTRSPYCCTRTTIREQTRSLLPFLPFLTWERNVERDRQRKGNKPIIEPETDLNSNHASFQ